MFSIYFLFCFFSFPIFYQIDLLYVFPFFTLPLCNWEIIHPISIFLMIHLKLYHIFKRLVSINIYLVCIVCIASKAVFFLPTILFFAILRHHSFSNELFLFLVIVLFLTFSLFVFYSAAGKSNLSNVFFYLCGSIQQVFDNSALTGNNSWCLLLQRWHHCFTEFIVLHLLGVALSDHDVPSGFLVYNIFILKRKKSLLRTVQCCMAGILSSCLIVFILLSTSGY